MGLVLKNDRAKEKITWTPSPDIDIILSEVLRLKKTQPRPSKFRVSSLPYCPIYNLYEDFHSNHEYDYSTSFYTGFGNAIHATFQEFLPHHPTLKVFGDWECLKCHKTCKAAFSKKAKEKLNCDAGDCLQHLQYKEFELQWKNLSGHTDMIIKFKGKWYLIDFKSTSSALWRSPAATMKSRKFPSEKYWEQIDSYAAMLYQQYKIKIDYYVIVYVGRDGLNYNKKPMLKGFKRRFNKKTYQRRMHRLEHFNAQYEKYAKFLKKPNKKNIDILVKARPCHSATDYNEKMQAKFEFKPCPNLANYVCRTDEGVANFLKGVAGLAKDKNNVSK